MEYEFSIESFFFGLGIFVIGILFMRFHQVIANNLGSGWPSYDRFKLWALIICIVGILVTLNLHWFLIINILNSIFGFNN